MKDILNIIKTILIYIFLPFRVIFLFLLLLFSNVVIHYIKDDSSISSVFLIFGKIIMFTLSLTIDISNEDYIKYMTYLYSDKKFTFTEAKGFELNDKGIFFNTTAEISSGLKSFFT